MQNKYGPILSVEQETVVGNLNLVSDRDYNMMLFEGFIRYKHGAFVPKRTSGPLIFISKCKVPIYNINNQLANFD